VHTLNDARDALSLLQSDSDFDVIFCDLMMPRMSGIEFYGELRRLHPELLKRTVFVTGGAINGQARQFLNTVSTRCVEKPFSAKGLHATVAQVLDSAASAPPLSGLLMAAEARRAL
jgi:CheY-like chemotaxis protein